MNEKVIMRTLDKDIRIKNFEEVNLGYNKEEAIKEASRCLNCRVPRCVTGCPVGIKIPQFIEKIKNDDIEGAYNIISEDNFLPGICGRVCPQERQCEASCVRGLKGESVSIGALERYVADEARKNKYKKVLNNKKVKISVAIIGSGPSGLSCAGALASNGYDVTIYEALQKCGGVLAYGIPSFRLPKDILKYEIDNLISMGVKIKNNVVVGKTISVDELKEKYDYIYIGTGAGLPKFLNIPNETANGVFSANEILTRINLMRSSTPIYEKNNVIVVGGGNVAMDASRALKRLGKNVTVCYRRSMDELPARIEEVNHAIEEGINFNILVSPKEVIVDESNNVTGLKVIKMNLVDKGNVRKDVEEIDGSEYIIPCDMIISAIGTSPNKLALKNTNIQTDDKGRIIVDDTKTSEDSIYAGGDIVTGSATVILAMEAGKKAAFKIIEENKQKR